MNFGQVKPIVARDPAIAAREADDDRMQIIRGQLNREMLRLPIEERRRRWAEYYARLDDLMKQSVL